MEKRQTRWRWRWRWPLVGCGLVAVLVVAGCGGSSWDSAVPAIPEPTGGPGVGQPEQQTNCTEQVTDGPSMQRALDSAAPGDRICVSGDMGDTRLEIKKSGTSEQPIMILGGGKAITSGITIEADNVLVDGVAANEPRAPGISIRGNDITVQNSTSISPRGGDGDGIRFWGKNIRILHNLVRETRGTGRQHADAIQTFATSDEFPASQNILIDSNRFEQIDNMCLIAEGPNSEAGDGSGEGESTNLVFSNNYCDNGASQATFVDDVRNVTVANNEIAGDPDKAFSFQNGSIGAKVSGNRLNPAIKYTVGMDGSSAEGYMGPEPGGGP